MTPEASRLTRGYGASRGTALVCTRGYGGYGKSVTPPAVTLLVRDGRGQPAGYRAAQQ